MFTRPPPAYLLENRRRLGTMLRQPEHILTPIEKALRRVLLALACQEVERTAKQIISGRNGSGGPAFVIKPVGDGCNYRCVYCFHQAELAEVRRMNLADLRKIYEGIHSVFGARFQIIWHGGEPLLAGKQFFASALALQEEIFGKDISNCIQTNGSLIDEEWAAFFKKKHIEVGISLDGDQEINDQTRRNAGGKSGYEATLRGIGIIRAAEMRVCVISVITRGRRDGRKHYRLMHDNGIVACNINPTTQPDHLRPTPTEHATFVNEFIQAWAEAGGANPVPRLLNILFPLLIGKPTFCGCIWNGTCYSILEVQPDGRVKGVCDRNVDFAAFPEVILGNLLSDTPQDVLAGERLRQYIHMITEQPQACQNCPMAWTCRGGCVQQRMTLAGTLALPDPYCDYYRQVVDFMQTLIDQVRDFRL